MERKLKLENHPVLAQEIASLANDRSAIEEGMCACDVLSEDCLLASPVDRKGCTDALGRRLLEVGPAWDELADRTDTLRDRCAEVLSAEEMRALGLTNECAG